MVNTALTILLLPLLAFVLIVFVTRKNQPLSAGLSIVAMGIAMLESVFVVMPAVMAGQTDHFEFNWLRLLPGGVPQGGTETFLRLGIQVDPLAAIMLVVVTVVSFLVQVYSRSYMIEHGHRDPGYSRFFAYLSLFTFSMLAVVLADNLLFLFIGWELVGLCSYLLIGFWFDRGARRGVHLLPPWIAAKKAFITTRVGDVGFLIGLIILWNVGGTLQLSELFDQAEHNTGHLLDSSLLLQPVLFWACLCLFAGAVGKSGQFPLHVWLPDAMEGPTPVSALIHAATMVAAGVYLVARTYPLFEAVPQALTVVAVIGGFTAIFAASMGLASNDIKRILAYSTVSQLGYMMLALGAGSLAAGMFHLFTHAFFKALLFLAAGSVIHVVGTNDITEMGGLRKYMPRTYLTMAIGGLSLAGFPFFAGFWSKDEVLAASTRAGPILLLFGIITVFLTAFYTFRMFFLTFHGKYRGPAEVALDPTTHAPETDAETHDPHWHESDWWMTGPLIVLAIPALVIGFWGSPFLNNGFQRFLEGSSFRPEEITPLLPVVGSVLAIAGIAVAWVMYGARQFVTEPLARFGSVYTLLARRYYIDELYMWLIDKLVIGVGLGLAIFDRQALDGLVNGIGNAFSNGGQRLRTAQTGRVQNYGLVLFGGMAVIAARARIRSADHAVGEEMILDQNVGRIVLQLVLWLPLLGGGVVALAGSGRSEPLEDAHSAVAPSASLRAWRIATFFAAITFILAAWLMLGFDRSRASVYQFETRIAWLPFGSDYRIAVDGLSMPLVALNALLTLSAIAGSWRIAMRQPLYFSLFLILESAVAGVFTAGDLFLFFLFWELELIPMFLIIGIWGGARREYAAFKFILFTFAGSAFMLVGIFLVAYFGPKPLTFGIPEIARFDFGQYGRGIFSLGGIAFILLFVGFAVKVPVFPFHTWLPDAHVEAPTAGSVMLAGVLLKMGGYGLLRLCITLLPQSAQDWQWLLIILAVVNSIYGAFVALAQTDLKKMIANSSISHMGYVILGIAALTQVGFHGALLVMLAHGLYSGLLFSMVGLVYDRTHTREVGAMSGLAARMPFIATVFMLAGLASLGLPGLAGFVAEFTTFIGAYSIFPFATILCVCTIAITAGYILWRLGSVFFGPLLDEWGTLGDAIWRERIAVGLLAAATLLIGVVPSVVADMSAGGVAPIAAAIAQGVTR